MNDTSVLDRKLAKAFEQLDTNHDGEIDHDDVAALAGRMLDNLGEPPTGAKGQNVLNGFETWWQALLSELDLDGERRIDNEQWRTGMVGAFVDREDGFGRSFEPVVAGVLNLADTNNDGVIQPDEWRVLLERAFGETPDNASLSFAKLDANHDGALEVSELMTAVREYYTSTTETALGNWLYGQV